MTLLGEKLVAFRDTTGRVGLVQENCPHRGASLYFGRNSGGALRCVYHGWAFDADGRCVEMPSEPAPFCEKIRRVQLLWSEVAVQAPSAYSPCLVPG